MLLAKDDEGHRNLQYLVSMGFMEGFYYHPRIDRELLKKHSKGLYGLSACLGGVVNKPLLRDGEDAAAEAALEFRDIFEPGHFFLEIQDNGFAQQPRANEVLLNIGEVYDIPMVATADAHYPDRGDATAHEVLMCIQQNRSLDEFRERGHHSDQLFIKSPAQMWESFGELCPAAIENTVKIASSCNVELNLSETFLPRYGVPDGQSLESYLEQVAKKGLQRRFEQIVKRRQQRLAVDESVYLKRLDYKLSVINQMGFPGYFLIVWDFIRHAFDQGIPVGPGRGSGAGSLVAWALRITDLDPIANGLIFERFLNPERVSMPDFDIDFCQERRGEVIAYVAEKYGRDQVGQIVTFSELSAKSVIKAVGRVMQVPFAEINEITKLIPGLIDGCKVSIDQALKLEPRLTEIQQEKPVYKEIIGISKALEGLNQHTGMHAAGIVIGDKPLWEYVPCCRGKDGELVTQYAKDEVEQAGLVKFDFLGLKTLTVISKAVAHVERRLRLEGDGDGDGDGAAKLDLGLLECDDAEVYGLISGGDTDGVFQMESDGFKDLLKRLQPDCFNDIVAAVALYRPGPMKAGMMDDYIARKRGRQAVDFPHPVCEPILSPTYGVIVYQEQVMQIAVDLCGFSMGEADILRKAMGKKKPEVMAKMRAQFVDGAVSHSKMPEPDAQVLFSQIEEFAGYAFNKSHSAAYALIGYHTAWLKHYYPVEFAAALLSLEMRTQENIVKYVRSAREAGIAVRAPDVNRSESDFSVDYPRDDQGGLGTGEILFGLGAVKGVGDAAIDSIIESRHERAFSSVFDLCERVDTRKVNRKVLEALIKSGALSGFGERRAQMFAVVDGALEIGQAAARDRQSGQTSLFAVFAAADSTSVDAESRSTVDESYPEIDEWDERDLLRREKESLGFYLTAHPLDRFSGDIARLTSTTAEQLSLLGADSGERFGEVVLAGVVNSIREKTLKSGKGKMAFIALEDLSGRYEAVAFKDAYAEAQQHLHSDQPVVIRGIPMIEGDDECPIVRLRLKSVEALGELRCKRARAFEIRLSVAALNTERLTRLRELLGQNRGDIPASMKLTNDLTTVAADSVGGADVFCGATETSLSLPGDLNVNPTDDLLAGVDRLFGSRAAFLV